jgi:hypothetical protein
MKITSAGTRVFAINGRSVVTLVPQIVAITITKLTIAVTEQENNLHISTIYGNKILFYDVITLYDVLKKVQRVHV